MSIVINGIDMPKGNSTKNLLIYSDGRVFTGHKDDANYSAEELRTGKWIAAKYPFSKCSICKCYFDTAKNIGNFCPNCGSYNGGEQDG